MCPQKRGTRQQRTHSGYQFRPGANHNCSQFPTTSRNYNGNTARTWKYITSSIITDTCSFFPWKCCSEAHTLPLDSNDEFGLFWLIPLFQRFPRDGNCVRCSMKIKTSKVYGCCLGFLAGITSTSSPTLSFFKHPTPAAQDTPGRNCECAVVINHCIFLALFATIGCCSTHSVPSGLSNCATIAGSKS